MVTIYRLYSENGNRAGFWVQHRSWSNLCARVHSIGGQQSGRLPGEPPLHSGAPIGIECFDVRSGRRSTPPGLEEDLAGKNFVSIAQPVWYKDHALT